MPAAVPIIAAQIIISAGGFTGLAAVGIMAAGAAISAGLSSMLQRKALKSMRDSLDSSGLQANTRTTQAEIRSLYGLNKVGGNDVYMATTGTDNKKLWIVQTLSEGLCNGIQQVDGVDQVFLGEKLYTEYRPTSPLVTCHFHDGAGDQVVDADLAAAVPEWTDCLRNTCYIVYEIDYHPDWFQSLPQRTVMLEGRHVYDFRDSTWKYSANAALVLYSYLTDESFPLEYDSALFDLTTWTDAADYCDAKSFTWQGSISSETSPMDVINDICAHFRGKLTWDGAQLGLKIIDLNYESAVMALTDAYILRDESGRVQVTVSQPGLWDTPDGLRVRFVSADKGYVEDCVIVGSETGQIEELSLPGCRSREQAHIIGLYELERLKLGRVVSGTFRDDAGRLEPYDVVTLTVADLGITSALMRVLSAEVQTSGLVSLSMVYEAESLYDDLYNLETDALYVCDLPDPTAEPPNVGNVTVAEEVYAYRLRSFTRLTVTFDEPAGYPWYDHVDVYLSFDNVNWEYLFPARTSFQVDPLEEGQRYYLRLKTVSSRGVRQADSSDLLISHIVLGRTAVPASVASLSAIVNSNAVNLFADKVVDDDVELYEFRLGSSWAGGIFLSATKNPNLSLYGVKPGTHTFWLDTLGNTGLYGATPRSRAISLPEPPHGWTAAGNFTDDFSTGTHDNTEATTYSGEAYLECSHTGGVLTGTYLSPIFDMSSNAQRLIYISADIVVTGAGTTWESAWAVGALWNTIDLTQSWMEIFNLPSGPTVRMKLLYGAASPPTSEAERMEILSTMVTARYLQVQVEIVDPNAQTNCLVEHLTVQYCT